VDRLSLTTPDDWHLHLRDGAQLAAVLPHTARQFARAVVMPNLDPPVTTTAQALAYRERIRAARPAGSTFEPLMTLYLTEATPPEEIERAKASGAIVGVKLYPAGATTNSASGVKDWRKCEATLAKMQELGLPLQVHGEVVDPAVDVFAREAEFIAKVLLPLTDKLPKLRIVFEHVTSAAGVDFVAAAGAHIAATITPQHLLYNRNALFHGGIRPHWYCLPVLKREPDRQALLAAATSGNRKFFLGTDSAPHAQSRKEQACGCAGCFTAPHALELYAEAFEQLGALDKLEGFAAHHGADWYGLPRNTGKVTLKRERWRLPETYPYAGEKIVPLRAGEELGWKLDGG
jgi:dihydroorotase